MEHLWRSNPITLSLRPPWIALFFRNFFTTLPVEIEEAAKIDEATDFQIYYKIVLPTSLQP